MSQTWTGSRYIAATLKAYGITHVFFVDAILRRALMEMEKLDITRVLTHSEKAAAYMADGYARAAGRPGVCMAQSVGAANLASGLQDAYLARTPVVAITGHKAIPSLHRNGYQEIYHPALFQPVTRFSANVEDAKQLPFLLRQAFREATAATPRPAHLDLAGLMGEVVELGEITGEIEADSRHARCPAYRSAPAPEDVAAAAKALGAAKRPVIVAGTGAAQSDCGVELLALAQKIGAVIAYSLGGKGLVADRSEWTAGPVGHYSTPYTNKVVHEADLVVYVGCHTGDLVTESWRVPKPGTRTIHIDPDPVELGRNYMGAVGMCGDPKLALAALIPACAAANRADWLARARALRAEWEKDVAPREASSAKPIAVERLCREITEALPANGILVADTGWSGVWTSTMIAMNGAGQTYLRAAGSLGWAFPASIGAQCAVPERPVICFTGDGGFYYHMAEMETAKRWNVPVTVVVNNNTALGQCIVGVRKIYEGNNGKASDLTHFRPMDFSRVAKEFGWRSVRVEDPKDLAGALRDSIAAREPCLLDVVTDPEAVAPQPWVPA